MATPILPVLVVEDNPEIRSMVVEMLEFEGYHVAEAPNGAEGLKLLESIRPGLVLLDMRMPVLDGWGFARALKQQEVRPPVVVMTATENARRWAYEVEADGYLAKPFDLKDLLEAVARFHKPRFAS
ncbi:MAG TPA: response regulator [Chloroflexia bacterium]|nr:response regulator [Chloroflexia bacterium]